MAEPQTPKQAEVKPHLLYGIIGLCLAGVGVAIYLVRHKLHITLDPGYVSSCNVSATVNCDAVNVSGMSEVFKLPVALYAIPTYALTIYLAVLGLRARTTTDAQLKLAGATAIDLIAGIGLLTSAFSMFLAWYSTVKVEAYCLYCISLYAVNIGTAALALNAGPQTVGNAISRAVGHLAKFAEPIAVSAGVVVIAGGVAWYTYDRVKERMELEYKSKIDAMMAGGEGVAAGGTAPAAAAAQVAGNAPAAEQKPSTAVADNSRQMPTLPGLKKTAHGVQVGGKMTPEDGWTYALFPINEGIDFVYGNPNATVTVVKISDYECPYCKFLALTMEPVKQKFKDKVRFVMKQFPMNPACNRYMMGYDKHPNACNASLAGVCAGKQGKFWEMHDKLYAEQPKLSPEDNRKYAQELGLDLAKYDACLKDPATMELIKQEIEEAHEAGINGAPRTYINGRLVTGSATTNILEYMIQKTLENPNTAPGAGQGQAAGPKPDGSHMLAAQSGKGKFFIDPYEAALTADGKAVSLPGVDPAQVSWTEADAACQKAGKRLCTEDEWASACSGKPQVDNNNNNMVTDDDIEGARYPYGDFYDAGTCRDQEDKYKGKAGKTGSKDGCRTAAGVYDLAGNIGEWTGVTKESAGLMGGHASSGESAACNQRSASFGVGNRNQTTGFRCCADSDVAGDPKAQVKVVDTELVGKPVPAFSAKSAAGPQVDTKAWKGKVTLVNFFASWCGPCKKEFPELVNLQKELGAKGFQVLSIGVDREPGKSLEFAKGFEAGWPIVEDPESELMGRFGVYSMPATFLVDRQGVVKFMDTGFKPEEQAAKLRSAIQGLL
jgi:protein-disulfide isomerase/uncharacterized membrane protein